MIHRGAVESLRNQERSQELGNLGHLSKSLWNKLFQQQEDSMVWVSEGGWAGGQITRNTNIFRGAWLEEDRGITLWKSEISVPIIENCQTEFELKCRWFMLLCWQRRDHCEMNLYCCSLYGEGPHHSTNFYLCVRHSVTSFWYCKKVGLNYGSS